MSERKLTIVPTPVGNLGDLTFRALECLNNCDIVLAEDTRTSGILLKHYNVSKPMQSYHAHNEHEKIHDVIRQMQQGRNFCLITDAGTPGISDPGFLLVRECLKSGIEVECLPGATAFVPALVVSGLPADRFVFEGFLPVKKGRKTRLEKLANEERTMIIYESPYKLKNTLDDLQNYLGADRKISVSREISKKFEQTVRGSIQEIIEYFLNHPPKGEFVIVADGKKSD